MSLRVWVRGLLIRWVWVRGLLSASGWGGGLLSLRVWVRSFLTRPRAGSGYGASSASGSVTKLDVFFFPRFLSIPNEAPSRNGYRLLSTFGEERPFHPCSHHPSEEPASCGVRQETGRDKFTVFSAHHTLRSFGRKIHQQCTLNGHIHSLWCHSSCIICCMQAYMYTVSKSPILCTCEFSSSHTNS